MHHELETLPGPALRAEAAASPVMADRAAA
jgi:hypothetical protein